MYKKLNITHAILPLVCSAAFERAIRPKCFVIKIIKKKKDRDRTWNLNVFG